MADTEETFTIWQTSDKGSQAEGRAHVAGLLWDSVVIRDAVTQTQEAWIELAEQYGAARVGMMVANMIETLRRQAKHSQRGADGNDGE